MTLDRRDLLARSGLALAAARGFAGCEEEAAAAPAANAPPSWEAVRKGRTRNFALLCGYRLDVFDRVTQATALPGVCHTHSHVRLAADPASLAQAVDGALHEVLGEREAEEVYASVGREIEDKRVPAPGRLVEPLTPKAHQNPVVE